MDKTRLPPFCHDCITRFQAKCPHKRIERTGGMHLWEGEVWDDIHDECLDCGLDFRDLLLADYALDIDKTTSF